MASAVSRDVEAVRDAVPLQHLAQLVGARRGVPADHADQLHAGAVVARPLGQKLAHHRVEVDLGGDPGLEDVVVEPAERASLEDRRPGAPIAPGDQQRALGLGIDGGRRASTSTPVISGIHWSATTSATGSPTLCRRVSSCRAARAETSATMR